MSTEYQPNILMKTLDKRLGTEFPSPVQATSGAAGYDVVACLDTARHPTGCVVLKPGERYLVPLGFSMHIQDPKVAAVLLPRSGLGHKKGLVLGNLVGLIDSDYQGQVFASMWNTSDTAITIEAGQKIAQMVFLPIISPRLIETDTIELRSKRGSAGFGSTS